MRTIGTLHLLVLELDLAKVLALAGWGEETFLERWNGDLLYLLLDNAVCSKRVWL